MAFVLPPKGAQIVEFFAFTALTVAALMLSFVCPFGFFVFHTFPLTFLAKNINFVVEKISDTPLAVLCLQLVFTAGGAPDRLAGFARFRPIAELVLRFPFAACFTTEGSPARIAAILFLIFSVFLCRFVVIV